MFEEASKRSGRVSYWLISKNDEATSQMLTVGAGGSYRALPIFSFPEEAEFFRTLGGFAANGWSVVEKDPGEVFAMLVEGTSVEVEFVALDPLPETMDCISRTTMSLVSVSRQRFIQRLANERKYAISS